VAALLVYRGWLGRLSEKKASCPSSQGRSRSTSSQRLQQRRRQIASANLSTSGRNPLKLHAYRTDFSPDTHFQCSYQKSPSLLTPRQIQLCFAQRLTRNEFGLRLPSRSHSAFGPETQYNLYSFLMYDSSLIGATVGEGYGINGHMVFQLLWYSTCSRQSKRLNGLLITDGIIITGITQGWQTPFNSPFIISLTPLTYVVLFCYVYWAERGYIFLRLFLLWFSWRFMEHAFIWVPPRFWVGACLRLWRVDNKSSSYSLRFYYEKLIFIAVVLRPLLHCYLPTNTILSLLVALSRHVSNYLDWNNGYSFFLSFSEGRSWRLLDGGSTKLPLTSVDFVHRRHISCLNKCKHIFCRLLRPYYYLIVSHAVTESTMFLSRYLEMTSLSLFFILRLA
jgi:hypothetical protein